MRRHRPQRCDDVLAVGHLHRPFHVDREGEQRRGVRLVQTSEQSGERSVIIRVWQRYVRPGERLDSNAAAAGHLVAEELAEVGSQHDDVVRAVHPPAVDGALQQPVELRPLRIRAAVARLVDDIRAGSKVGEGKLVKFGPALRHVRAPLLHHGVEPREQEQELGAERAAVRDVLG